MANPFPANFETLDGARRLTGQVNFTDVANQPGGQPVLSTSVSLTSAQIKQLFTTPVQIVAAQGANKLIVPIMAAAKLTYVAPAYVQTSNDKLIISYTGYTVVDQPPLQLASAKNDPADLTLLEATADAVSLADHEAAWYVPASVAINTEMVVQMTGHNPTTGNGTLAIALDYRVVTF